MLGHVAVEQDFPLFPLRLVALPSELIPLHIFEERYKTMMARCLEHEHRDDAIVGVQRRPQRRVVVDAQVATEPDEGRGHLRDYVGRA